MPGAAVSVRNLSHRYRSAAGGLTVLEDLSLDIGAGGYVSIAGASGAGKSTLLAVLGGLDAPQRGEVMVDGRNLHTLNGDQLAEFRRDTVGFVFQHFGLLETLTAAENIALAHTLTGDRAAVGRRRATELLEAVGLGDRADHQPSALSGGERQRVAIARSLVNEPRVLLADEPTGNLDDESSARVIDLLEAVHADRGCTLVVVTHDRRVALRARQIYRLVDGRLRSEERIQ